MRGIHLGILTLLAAVACSDKSAGPEDPSGIAVSGNDQSNFRVWGTNQVVVGGSALLGATFVSGSNDSTPAQSASWTSRDPAVATITGRGAYADLAAVALGTAWIVASADGSVDSLEVAVVPAGSGGGTDSSTTGGSGPVASVSVSLYPSTVSVGDSAGARATLFDAKGLQIGERAVVWTVSDPSVAAIEWQYGANVLLRAKGAGTATLTATSEGKSGTATLTVR